MPTHPWIRRCLVIIAALFITSCASFLQSFWNERYGQAHAIEYSQAMAQSTIDYDNHVKPIIEMRCTVCHGCYDAPCQLKLDAYQGLLRGANPDKVYDGTRLFGANMTRLFEDAHSTQAWRDKKFFPVLNERDNTPENNREAGVLARLLTLKQHHPLPKDAILPESFDFALNRNQQCPRIETIDSYEKNFPLWGMPYGLPGLTEQEHNTLMTWLENGAPPGPAVKIDAHIERQINQWENFFNGDSIKQQLANRYIYEHLFLANLYFPEAEGLYFQMVRSSTPPGQPLQRITTTRPFDDPGVARVYYRLWQDPSSIVAKTHMPYRLDAERQQRWQQLFYETSYDVTALPGYDPTTAANPFKTFAELPVGSRYRFMLEEAQFTIMNFIKGPVCRGQVALNVIQDHFWVVFVTPELMSSEEDAIFFRENSNHLQLPASVGNTLLPLNNWSRYSTLQKEYLAAKAHYVSQKIERQGAISLDMIWNGYGTNDNAALTIFRHSDSASVIKGLVGNDPKTAWVIGYPLLERIHYLLVAGFDVYGNLSHQLLSRLYMDFLRMEGEMTFLDFLPPQSREAEMMYWYHNAEKKVHEYLSIYQKNLNVNNDIPYRSNKPKHELFAMLREHLKPVLNHQYDIAAVNASGKTRAELKKLHDTRGSALRYLPQTTVIRIEELGVFSLLHNNAFSNLSSLFNEEGRRMPEKDSLTLAKGVIGAYPNAFMYMSEQQLPDFVNGVQNMASEADYLALRAKYGIRRSDPDFWAFSDGLHASFKADQPAEAGLLDYNRLENR